MSNLTTLRYALVTPARNEAEFIERTLESVVRQTLPPIRWIVVSDASTDGTDAIVQRYAQRHPWIELLHLFGPDGRDFARKARAFNAGYERLRSISYDIIGNLDADVSVEPELFEFLLGKFAELPHLGVAGVPYREGMAQSNHRFANLDHVHGCCQLFRRACFEDIGGYVPLALGGGDWIAVTTARMRGWQTRSFTEKAVVHHRDRLSAGRQSWRQWFRQGEKDFTLGGHPLWEVARGVYRATSRPYVLGSVMLLAGYAYRSVRGPARPVTRELIRFHRAEQMGRLKRAAVRVLLPAKRPLAEPQGSRESIAASVARLECWVETREYKGYEPFDALSSYVRPLTFGHPLLERMLQQVGRQSPINLRPLLGIKPLESTKGRGYMTGGYLGLLQLTGAEEYRHKATACLDWLTRNQSPLYPDYSWGNHFDYASRAGQYAKHESTIVWTSLIGQAFLDGYEALGDARYLDVAASACNWILKLPREHADTGACLSYLADRQLSVHNANLLGAGMLARTAKHIGRSDLIDVARAAMQYSCARQRQDGSWYYGEDRRYAWIDNFHTGYNLDAIKCYMDSTGDDTFAPHLERGFRYYKTHFFEDGGRPKYYHDRAYPIDIQCAAQGIESLVKFAAHDPDALPTARQVANWTIRNMQDPSGYFYYRRYPLLVARIPMIHWGQATMYRALALLLLALARVDGAILDVP